MTKKILVALLAVMLILSVVACDRGGKPSGGDDYKIGVYTGTVSQGEEEYQAGQKMKERHGDKIVTATYPDNFSSEVEQVIQGVLQLASDEKVKAIVFVQAVPGAAASIDKVREIRPDMLFVAGVCAEDPEVMSAKADVNLLVDEISMGSTIPTEAARMGATRFVHISFPRHLGYTTIATRRQIMIETCAELGIEFLDLEAPDPTGDAGISGAQQFIREDIPKRIAEYGPDTAFFSTNCGLQEPLIQEILKGGAIYPQQCCPSPYHAYPAALGVDLEGHEGDVKYMLQSIKDKLTEAGQESRMSTWGVPINMLMLEAGVEYAIEFCEGKFTDRHDKAALERAIKKVSDEYKAGEIQITNYVTEDDKELDNFYMLLAPFVDFSKPID
ncbi:MAG: DUF3798 domain-containing protein [Clostridiaceae bacterium]|nr:DUF3798 domain-containing protein [Clostridiaceae bacterium]